jgi:hypothetical protein
VFSGVPTVEGSEVFITEEADAVGDKRSGATTVDINTLLGAFFERVSEMSLMNCPVKKQWRLCADLLLLLQCNGFWILQIPEILKETQKLASMCNFLGCCGISGLTTLWISCLSVNSSTGVSLPAPVQSLT